MKIFSQSLLSALFALIYLSFWSPTIFASCGDIITRYFDYDLEDFVEKSTPIEDCDNPFNVDTPEPFTYELSIAEQSVTEGAVISVIEGEPVAGSFEINKSGNFAFPFQLFRHEGEDFRQVDLSEDENYLFDSLQAGEYVAVLTYELPPFQTLSEPIWKQFIKKIFLPNIAYAFFPDDFEVVAVSFTIEYETTEPLGASSVLFLPGIQASRLYTEGALGTENKLWEPNRNADVDKLTMTSTGASINDIYTRDVIDEIPSGGNIYETFLDQMEELKSDKVIRDFEPFAYDWRYSVFDVAKEDVIYENETKHLLDEVLALAEESYTGKVTLIGHSNGGLVAKALLYEYGETYLAGKIDKFIMIGTPQLGTPKAIGSMLHGLDQSLGFGLVATADTIRQVTRNLPGAYTLLPSQGYFNEISEPVITTDGSELAELVSTYGDIDSASRLQNFLLNSLGNRDEAMVLSEPIILNAQISSEATDMQNILDTWHAPDGVEVYEVVGTGLATIKGYRYREFSCAESNPSCILHSYLKPFPIMTNEGDQTVMGFSAEGYKGDKVTAVVDLKEENSKFATIDRTHKNLTESDSVQIFVDSVIKYPYFTDSVIIPEFTRVNSRYTIVGVHSPVSILAKDQAGNQVGVVAGEIKTEISGSQYFELGDSKYLVLPAEIDVSIELAGTGEGVYSLSIDEVNESGRQSQKSLLANATTSLTMKAEFAIENGVYSLLKTDLDGDGETDLEQTLNGEVINQPDPEYSYSDLREIIENLNLKHNLEKGLMVKVRLAEFFSREADKKPVFSRLETRILNSLDRVLDRYAKRRIISEEDLSQIKVIINNLNQNEK